jgi:hypothetical protein
MKVIESFLPKSYQNEIEQLINDPSAFQWSFYDKIAIEYGEPVSFKNPKIINPIGLSHTFIESGRVVSNHWERIRPILLFLEYHQGIEIQRMLRVRARRTLRDPSIDSSMFNPPHIDLPNAEPYKTLIYYVSDSDGDSIFFNEQYDPNQGQPTLRDDDVTECFRYTPVKGNGILFDGHRYHSGNSPVEYLHRTIINFDFIA